MFQDSRESLVEKIKGMSLQVSWCRGRKQRIGPGGSPVARAQTGGISNGLVPAWRALVDPPISTYGKATSDVDDTEECMTAEPRTHDHPSFGVLRSASCRFRKSCHRPREDRYLPVFVSRSQIFGRPAVDPCQPDFFFFSL